MQNNLQMWIVAGLLVVGAGAGAFFMLGGSETEISETLGESDGISTQKAAGVASLQDLIRAGGSQVCTFESEDLNAKNIGTVYLSEGNVRGDFQSTVSATGMTVASHMLQKGVEMYTWSDAGAQGVKVTIDASGGTTGMDGMGQTFNPNIELAYDCDNWNPDASKFQVPADITFMDLSTMPMPIPSF